MVEGGEYLCTKSVRSEGEIIGWFRRCYKWLKIVGKGVQVTAECPVIGAAVVYGPGGSQSRSRN